MAVRQDKIQISVSFITDESKAYAKLIEDNKAFTKDLKTAQKNGLDVSDTLKKIVAAGKQVEGLNLNQLTPSQLVARANQLKEQLKFIPTTHPGYVALSGEFKKINDLMATLNARTRGVAEGLGQTGSAFSRFVAGAIQVFGGLSLDRVVGAISQFGIQLFKIGPQLDVFKNKAQTVFAETLPKVTAEANANAAAMGLTAAEYTNAAAAAGDLLVPMGFTRQESAGLSTQLVNLSGVLSEWTGGQRSATEVSGILTKAILSEREGLKGLGIAINEEDVQNRVREKGLDKLSGSYRRQAEAVATVELILERSTDAQNAFAKGSDTLVRRQAELAARLKGIAETLAIVLLPVFERLVDFAAGFADVLSDVAEGIEGLVNPAKAANEAFTEQRLKVNELEKELPGLLKRYDELTGKSTLTKDEQSELAKVIAKIGEITPTAITEIDNYGVALGINATKSREFLEAEQNRLKFLNKEAIRETEELSKQLKGKQTLLKLDIERGKTEKLLANSNKFGSPLELTTVVLTTDEIIKKRNQLRKATEELAGAEAQLKFLQGKPIVESSTPPSPGSGLQNAPLDPDEINKEAKARQKSRQEEIDLELKAVEVAIAKKQVVVESDRLNNLIGESDYQKHLLQLQEEEYNQQLEVYKRFGADQTLQALDLRKKLLQVQQDLQPNERIDIEALPGRNQTNNVSSQTGARQRGEEDIETRFGIQEQALRDSFRRALILEEEYQLMSLQLERNKIEAKLALLANAAGEDLKVKTQLEKDKAAITEQIAEEQAAADQRRKDEELQRIQAISGATADLFGLAADLLAEDEKNRRKNASAIKAFQSAQIIINGILEVQRIWAAAAELGPIAGPIYGVVATGVAVGRSALALSKVQNTKLARGAKMSFGIFGGKPHSAGGTKGYFEDGTAVEVERDEAFVVVNKRSTSMLRALSGWNQAGGGIPFFRHGGAMYMEGGGLAAINTTPSLSAATTSNQVNIAPLVAQVDRLLIAIEQPRNIKANVVLTEYEAVKDEMDSIRNDAAL